MLHRLRQAARRWPGLCLGLVLLGFTSQAVASTLDWCLHAGEGAHVANGLAPCDLHSHDAAGLLSAEAADGPATPHPMVRFAASSEVSSPPGNALVALSSPASWQFLPRIEFLEASGTGAARHARLEPWREAGRHAIAGAVHGATSRLLI